MTHRRFPEHSEPLPTTDDPDRSTLAGHYTTHAVLALPYRVTDDKRAMLFKVAAEHMTTLRRILRAGGVCEDTFVDIYPRT